MELFNSLATRIFDAVFFPLNLLGPSGSIIAISILAGIALLFVYGKVSNQKAIKKVMSSAGTREDLLIQALKNLGKDHIDQTARMQILKFLKGSTEKEVRQNMKFAPAWIRAFVFEILELES